MTSLIEPEFALPAEDIGAMFWHMQPKYAFDLWLDELARNGLADRTRTSYRRIAYGFADWLGPTVSVRDITTLQIRRWFDENSINQKRHAGRKSAGTINTHITVINRSFDWMMREGIIEKPPHRRNGGLIFTRLRTPNPVDNDNVVSITSSDVRKCLEACRDWDEKLCLYTLGYLGPRRHALALAKITDYDPGGTVVPARPAESDDPTLVAEAKRIGVALPASHARPESVQPATLTFREKGAKTIAKPVPDGLRTIIEGAIAAGVYDHQDWLVPNRKPGQAGAVWLERMGETERDDRLIYDLVKKIGERAGVTLHVHAFRAAFAVYFLERGGDLYDLQLLMGHASADTTRVYARRLDKKQRMARAVANLDWGVSA